MSFFGRCRPVIAQACLPIEAGDDEQLLAQRLLPLEHRLLPTVLGLLVSGRLRWDGQAPRFDDQPLATPLRLGDDGLQP